MARIYVCGITLIFGTLTLLAQETQSLGEIARQLKAQKNGSQPAVSRPAATGDIPVTAQNQQRPATVMPVMPSTSRNVADDIQEGEQYSAAILQLFQAEKFQEIDRLASEARTSKARFTGGGWKLHTIYSTIGFPAQGQDAPDFDWAQHLARLERWKQQFPNSITARIALAESYDSYGWKARGGGFADKVTEEGWQLLAQRSQKARQILTEAQVLPDKCPEWFLAMMHVARSQSWEADDTNALFEKAAVFEPDYHYYFEHQADSHLPKWGGEEGEVARFAEAVADRLGGKKSDIMYFRIAASLICTCDNQAGLNGLSWPRIKTGYSALQELYGTSIIHVNEMALMAYRASDFDYSATLFDQIGDRWDKTVWLNHNSFYMFKFQTNLPRARRSFAEAAENAKTPEGQLFSNNVNSELDKNYHQILLDCFKATPDDTPPALGFLIQLTKNGAVHNILFGASNAPDSCFRPQLEKAVLPPPPQEDYWVLVKMDIKR